MSFTGLARFEIEIGDETRNDSYVTAVLEPVAFGWKLTQLLPRRPAKDGKAAAAPAAPKRPGKSNTRHPLASRSRWTTRAEPTSCGVVTSRWQNLRLGAHYQASHAGAADDMDEATRLLIADAFPSLPEALAEAWIAPFIQKLGPPRNSDGWLNFLLGYPLEFLRDVSWSKEPVNLRAVIVGLLSHGANSTLGGMETGYYLGVPNAYAIAIPDGKETTERALEYLRQHRVFPSPPVLLEIPEGYEIMDGNHRMLAYAHAIRVNPPDADAVQEVWIGRGSLR